MSRTTTLTLLRDDIRFQADLIGATVRHTDAQLTRLVNQSIQEFREAISNDGNTHYLVPYSGTLTTGATSPYSFLSLDLSAISPSIVRTYGIDITIDNVVHSLEHRPFTERNIWGGPATTGIPKHWAHYQTAKLAIQPAPSEAYPYTLWYLPVLADLSGSSDTFDGVAGWEAWIVWDCVCRLLIRDQQAGAYSIAKQYRDDVWDRIKRNATRVSSAGGAVVGRDSLRGRIPDFLAARGPVMAGGGLPPSGSVTLDMMADMTGPAVIGRESGTGRPVVVGQTGIVSSIIPAFTPGLPGLVPAAGGSATNKFLSQAGTFETVSAGGGGGSPGGPSGSIQFAGLSGFVGYTGFAVQGSPPSMTVRLPGSLRVTGGTVDVGSGTVRISASGIDLGDGSLRIGALPAGTGSVALPEGGTVYGKSADGTIDARLVQWLSGQLGLGGSGVTDVIGRAGTTDGFGFSWQSADGGVTYATLQKTGSQGDFSVNGPLSAGDSFFNSIGVLTGIDNSYLAEMGSGTIKGNLGPTGVPQDIPIATLFAQIPTFTSARAGFVPPSGGGTDNFLRADGSFAIPPGVGSSPSGITNAQLAPMNSGTVKMRRSATGIPEDVTTPTLFAFFPTFSSNLPGLVPPSGGGTDNFLRADGAFAAPTGFVWNPTGLPNANLAVMPSGTVKANLTGTGAPADVLIPTLMMHFPTMTSSRAGIVGPGGGTLSNFLRADGQFAAPTGFVSTPTGLTNANLSVMPSGTVKMNLSGTAAPADVLVPTLMTLFPTFTSAVAGTVPPSGGGTNNFLRADGAWAVPPGGAASPGGGLGNVQYNNGVGGFNGGSGVNIVGSGMALAFGANPASTGDARVGSGFAFNARNASGISQPVIEWWTATGTIKWGSSGLARQLSDVASGGAFDFTFGGATAATARMLPTGFDFTPFHAALKSISVPNINGYPADQNQLSRGSITWMASGIRLYVPKGASTGANRFVVPTGALGTNVTITLWPTGARGGNTIRIERLDRSAGNITVQTPSGTTLYIMPSGTAEVADFVFTKPSGAAFELGGSAGLF